MSIIRKKLKVFLFLAAVLITSAGYAQLKTISGKVTDAGNGEMLPGVSVVVKGTTKGTATNFDGDYKIDVEANQTLIFSFIGYTPQEVVVGNENVINMKLAQTIESLEEVVVIGYGSVKKQDATGSVAAVNATDFNPGAIIAPAGLISGKIAGVQMTDGGGSPGEGYTVRIRGGSSLSASNDPLIVVDGVPVDNDGIAGLKSPLSTVYAGDIETFTVLKDASATAIYGSRASNGVILITTKKGLKGNPLKINYNQYFSVSSPIDKISVLSSDQFRTLVTDLYGENSNATKLLGSANTDWQDEIYRTAYGMDHNLSLTGNIKDMPFRASVAYTNQLGILKTDGMSRWTGSIGFNPSFFEDHLRVNLNLKGMLNNNQFANRGAIGSATGFDPTQNVQEQNNFGGYFYWKQPNGDPITPTIYNPVAQLNLTDDQADVQRSLGNLQLDYRFHFLPDLRANLNLGYDVSTSDGTSYTPDYAPWSYDKLKGGGNDTKYTQDKKNTLLDFYLNYVKDLESIDSHIDIMGGYSWQHFWRAGTSKSTNAKGTEVFSDTDYETENYLVSFFGRLNYTFKDRYLLTATLRDDGSSRFSPETRWGLFPSTAFAWKINDEPFMANQKIFSDLKLRAGWGVTGQQNISDNDYPYMPRYTYSEETAQYQFGNQYYITMRPEGYDANIKWEETTTYNVGLDYGFIDNRITGAIDYYQRYTDDLINFIPVPAGTNLSNYILTNVGNLENMGVEFSINATAISKKDLTWEIGFNAAYQHTEITKLTANEDPTYAGVQTGGISGGVGNNIQIHSVGYAPSSFFVYEQVYDEAGKPIEGLYVDRNGDKVVNDDDMYRYKKPAPDVFMGFSTKLNYKNWDFALNGRVSLGNYVYNNIWSGGALGYVYQSTGVLNNVNENTLYTGVQNPKYFSDYYVRHASFLKLDNMNVGYTFTNFYNSRMKIRLYGTAQNLLTLTEYEGLDPEIANGIDNNSYPRPRTFTFGVNIDF
jgi:TonB-dependent starch-binding outer membrane protein SusC